MKRKKFTTVYETSDYEAFNVLNGNRQLNKPHLRRLKKSMEEKYLFSPILCNERMEIIDGQHRFAIAQELGLPIRYCIMEGYSLPEVQRLNANTHDWSMMEYLDSFVRKGDSEYVKLNNFYQEWKQLGLNNCRALVAGSFQGSDANQSFKDGLFKCGNIKRAAEWATKLEMVGQYYDNYLNKSFVTAMMHLFRHPDYNHAEFLSKLSYQTNTLTDCRKAEQYLLLIDEIYNYRRREKVSLKYLPTLKKAS